MSSNYTINDHGVNQCDTCTVDAVSKMTIQDDVSIYGAVSSSKYKLVGILE